MRRKSNLKLPNGFGSIQYLGKNRTKPYGARKTIGWDIETGKQIRKYVGFGKTWNEAYQILLEYNNSPYDLSYRNLTLEYVFFKVKDKLQEQVDNSKMSKSNYAGLVSAWNCHLNKAKDINIFELRKKSIQSIIDNSNVKYNGKKYIKSLFSKLVDYIINELEIDINKNICNLDIGEKEKSNKHKPLRDNDVFKISYYAKFDETAKMIMIYLYTGMRPSELLDIKIRNVYLNEDYMIGGSKTEAGKNRIIPIHTTIKKYILYFYDINNEYLIINKYTNKQMTYDSYEKRFKKLMNRLNMDYKPHDPRHTFATRCDELEINPTTIKIIMGHSLSNDVTQDVYIHKSVENIKKEMKKFNYKRYKLCKTTTYNECK